MDRRGFLYAVFFQHFPGIKAIRNGVVEVWGNTIICVFSNDGEFLKFLKLPDLKYFPLEMGPFWSFEVNFEGEVLHASLQKDFLVINKWVLKL